jgi:hypothetical protein
MKLILLSDSSGRARHIDFSAPLVTVAFIAAILAMTGGFGYFYAQSLGPVQSIADVKALQTSIAAQRDDLDSLKGRGQEQIAALAQKMGELNANAIRLDALGRRLTSMADLDDGEFDFDTQPAVGGPLEPAMYSASGRVTDLIENICSMDRKS